MTLDVLIVGAGIAGASLAWRLAGTREVLLLEAEIQPGLHSTGRSAAMYMASYGPPQARALTRAGRSFYQQPPEGFADVPLVGPRGV
ncbi:MAG: FAD-dependent oxidoreductase, partial [Rubrivivax sp.]|nr:FAD-dependent oxidoreductase [Rubrivivax sp.]